MYDYAFSAASSGHKSVEQAAGQAPAGDSPAALGELLPSIASAALESWNIIFRGKRRFSFEWPDDDACTVVLLPGRPKGTENQNAPQVICNQQRRSAVKEVYRVPGGQRPELVIEARLGRHRVTLCLSSTTFLELLDGENAALLPPEIKCALTESYLDNAIWRLEQASGLLISIDAVTHSPEELPARGYNLFFEMHRQGGLSAAWGYLSLDLQGLGCLAGILKQQDHPLAWERIDDLRIPVGFVLGSTRLHLSQINSLAPDDIVLLADVSADNQAPPIRIDVAGRPFWLAKKADNHLVVATRLEHTMEDGDKDTVPGNEDLTDLEEIRLELVFELGRKLLPLAEVRRIGPGYLFDLAGEISKPVSIYINGRRIGSGELVKIDNHLGVRLTEYLQRQVRCDY